MEGFNVIVKPPQLAYPVPVPEDALLELAYHDPLNAWEDIPVLELSGPLDGRLDAVVATLDQTRHPRRRD